MSVLEISEKTIISIMLNDNDVVEEASLKLKGSDFSDKKLGDIFDAICNLVKAKEIVSDKSVLLYIAHNPSLQFTGYEEFIDEIKDDYVGSEELESCIDTVKHESALRDLRGIGGKISTGAAGLDQTKIGSFVGSTITALEDIRKASNKKGLTSAKDGIAKLRARRKALAANAGKIVGLPTGFTKIDEITGGLHENSLNVIGAYSSVGKTAFALNILLKAAEKIKEDNEENEKKGTDADFKPGIAIYISLEMTDDEIYSRLAGCYASVESSIHKHVKLSPLDEASLSEAEYYVENLPIRTSETTDMKIADIKHFIRDENKKHNVRLLIVDYLQLIGTDSRGTSTREQDVGAISRTLKIIAGENKCAVVALSQLRRPPVSTDKFRADEKPQPPTMNDIRESGQIVQDADTVAILHRPINESRESNKEARDYIIEKNRHGSIGTIKLTFQGKFQKFTENKKDNDDDQNK
jgi:replicative DNA helicase